MTIGPFSPDYKVRNHIDTELPPDIANLTTDVETLQDEVETASTGLLDRTSDLETAVTAAESDIDDLETFQGTAESDITSLQGRASFLSGAIAPDNGDGSNGDLYLDTVGAEFYFKAAGVWASVGTLN